MTNNDTHLVLQAHNGVALGHREQVRRSQSLRVRADGYHPIDDGGHGARCFGKIELIAKLARVAPSLQYFRRQYGFPTDLEGFALKQLEWIEYVGQQWYLGSSVVDGRGICSLRTSRHSQRKGRYTTSSLT